MIEAFITAEIGSVLKGVGTSVMSEEDENKYNAQCYHTMTGLREDTLVLINFELIAHFSDPHPVGFEAYESGSHYSCRPCPEGSGYKHSRNHGPHQRCLGRRRLRDNGMDGMFSSSYMPHRSRVSRHTWVL